MASITSVSQNALSSLSTATISRWTSSDIAALGTEKIGTLTGTQLKALS